LAFPMLTGSFVTAAGFVPIGFARSAAGEYTFSIFAVVTTALIVSWFVAVLFAPLLGVWLLKKPETAAPGQQGAVVRIFRAILVGAMRMRWLTIALTLAGFVASLLALPYVPRQFFPASDRPELVVDLTLPQTPRSSPAIRSRPNSTPSLTATPTLSAGAHMSDVGPSAFIFRLTCNWPMTSFRRPS
jgi:multidrug efflux pump